MQAAARDRRWLEREPNRMLLQRLRLRDDARTLARAPELLADRGDDSAPDPRSPKRLPCASAAATPRAQFFHCAFLPLAHLGSCPVR